MELEEALYRRLADGQVHSEAGLAAELGHAQAEIRAALRRLAALGLDLAHGPGGWRLPCPLEPLDAAALAAALTRPLAGLEVHLALDSTSSRLARISHRSTAAAADPLALTGRAPFRRLDVVSATPSPSFSPCAPSERRLSTLASRIGEISGLARVDKRRAPRACLAEAQTGGRGRRGRRWRSPLGAGIYLSLAAEVTRPAAELGGLSLALGVGAAEALAAWAPAEVGLKWPNDLVLDGAKLGGILVESRPAGPGCRVVAGIGVNLRLPRSLRQGLEQAPAELGEEALRERNRIAAALIDALGAALERFAAEGFTPFAARWAARDVTCGREVVVSGTGGETLRGRACGVDTEGALRVAVAGGMEAVHAGDISLRLAP